MPRAASSKLDEVLRLIPGYDPFATAGDCRFDAKRAQRAIDFFHECLTFTAGEWMGHPFRLQPWQQAIVGNIFGWLRPDGRRRYREAFIFVPRKCGKSELAGGLGNLLTFSDGEPAAQVYCAAADREQARLVFNAAKTMVAAEPELASRSRTYTNSIVVAATNSVLKVVSAEAYSKHGVNAHGIIIDELHAQPNRELVDVLTTSTGARRQPLIVYITTSDYDRESICNEKHDYACKVRDGIIDDPAFLPVIYEAGLEDDWTDPVVWRKANPNLGVSVSEEYLERECKRAQESPAYENTFKRLHLNIRTEVDEKLITQAHWAAGGGPLDITDYEGRQCVGAVDLGATSDLTSLCLLFGDAEDGYDAFWWHWTPREAAETRERRHGIPYSAWARAGVLTLTDGDEIDYRFIRRDINALGDRFGIHTLGVDRLFQGAQLCQDLADDGFNVVDFGQGFMSMAAPTVEFLRLLKRGELRHGDNPLVAWQASNVVARMDPAGNIKPDKRKSGNKIDGIVTVIMALGFSMVAEDEPQPSVTVLY